MIRQAINCDICASEKQASNYWLVAFEQGGELLLCAWDSPKNSRRNAKHLCGQKCAQRMVANYMTALTTATHADEQSKELALTSAVSVAASIPAEPVERTGKILLAHSIATMDDIEAEAWA